jgi:hypothetical protein
VPEASDDMEESRPVRQPTRAGHSPGSAIEVILPNRSDWGADLAEAAFQAITAFPYAQVELPTISPVAAAIWCARLWSDRAGWAPLYLGYGGHYPKPGAGYTFRRWEERWYRWPDERGRLLRLALTSAPEADIYAGCLLRTTRSRKAGTAVGGTVAWADVDGRWTAQREVDLRRLDGLPVWQVASGHQGRHVYVRLGVEPEAPERIEVWNRRIGALLEADAGWSETKVLRLPGTLNHKPRAGRHVPTPVRWLS